MVEKEYLKSLLEKNSLLFWENVELNGFTSAHQELLDEENLRGNEGELDDVVMYLQEF